MSGALPSSDRSSQSDAASIAVRGTFAAFCASLVGLGLARFAYTPLLPAIVEAHWFSGAAAAYLGAANLSGYLAGALLGSPMARALSPASVLRAMMLLTTVSLFACAWPVDLIWFSAWRSLAGIGGGALMVLAAPTVLPHVAPGRRGLASGAIFMGVGIGVAASGSIEPMLIRQGLMQTWLALAGLSLVLTLAAWRCWPAQANLSSSAASRDVVEGLPTGALRAVYVEYALNAVGLVPHMIFLVDFVARGLGQGLAIGAGYWVVYGIGAIVGPLLSGLLADRIGFKAALRVAFVLQAVAVSLPGFGLLGPWLVASSFVMGAYAPGIVGLVLGRLHGLLAHHPAAHRDCWSQATTGFAILQAAAAYGMAYLLARSGGNYALLFRIGGASVVLALIVDLAVSAHSRRRTTSP